MKALVGAVGLVAVATAVTTAWSSPHPPIGGWQGVAFWVVVVALGSASVRMPGGAVVDVGVAPVLAAAVLGGPAAAAVVCVVGTLEWREIKGLIPGRRGGVPWYGTIYNHSSVLIPAVFVAWAYVWLVGVSFEPDMRSLAILIALGVVHVSINNGLTAVAIALREKRPVRSVLVANLRQFGMSLAGLAPLAWLMAAMYVVAGPIVVIPFAVPLYATRADTRRSSRSATCSPKRSAVWPARSMRRIRTRPVTADACRPLPRTWAASSTARTASSRRSSGAGCCTTSARSAFPTPSCSRPAPDEGRAHGHERAPGQGRGDHQAVAKLAPELPIIRHHHEWYNGSGYPDRLVGHGIPKLARILHVADLYEAMTAARPYRLTPLTQKQALDELHKFSGIQFDPEVVAAFDRLIARAILSGSRPTFPRGCASVPFPGLGETEAGPVPA